MAHRFFVPKTQTLRDRFWITDSKITKHARKVLRLKKDDEVVLFDGEGHEYMAAIEHLTKNVMSGIIKETRHAPQVAELPQLILAQALPKAGKLDEIIRMCTEAGVAGFIVFESDYSVAKSASFDKKKLERLKRVATAAARQSERLKVPEISGPVKFADLCNLDYKLKIILHSRKHGEATPDELRKALQQEKQGMIIIGPEGGFSLQELEYAEKNGVKVLNLKLPVMRTETSGVVAAAVLLVN